MVFATFYEGLARYKSPEEYRRITQSKCKPIFQFGNLPFFLIIFILVGKYISCFSLIKNWQRLRSENTNPDAIKMRSIQGIRFYNMICVILAHTVMVVLFGPVINTTFPEHVKKFEPIHFQKTYSILF